MDRKSRQFDRFPFENKQKSLEKISFLRNTVDKFHGDTFTQDEELALLFELARGSGFDVPDTRLLFRFWYLVWTFCIIDGVWCSRIKVAITSCFNCSCLLSKAPLFRE